MRIKQKRTPPEISERPQNLRIKYGGQNEEHSERGGWARDGEKKDGGVQGNVEGGDEEGISALPQYTHIHTHQKYMQYYCKSVAIFATAGGCL